jgi:hypothetical protein
MGAGLCGQYLQAELVITFAFFAVLLRDLCGYRVEVA